MVNQDTKKLKSKYLRVKTPHFLALNFVKIFPAK